MIATFQNSESLSISQHLLQADNTLSVLTIFDNSLLIVHWRMVVLAFVSIFTTIGQSILASNEVLIVFQKVINNFLILVIHYTLFFELLLSRTNANLFNFAQFLSKWIIRQQNHVLFLTILKSFLKLNYIWIVIWIVLLHLLTLYLIHHVM